MPQTTVLCVQIRFGVVPSTPFVLALRAAETAEVGFGAGALDASLNTLFIMAAEGITAVHLD